MKKILFFTVILFISITGVFSQNVMAVDREGKNVIIPSDQVITSDYFASGGTITLFGTVNGDAFLAGGNILFDGTVDGDLLIAGGNININGIVNGSVRVAGGNVIVNGKVGKNLSVASGTFTVGKNAIVDGNLAYISGKDTNISSSAVVIGKTTKLAVSDNDADLINKETNKMEPVFRGAGSALNVIGFSIACLIGFFSIKLFPKRTERKMEILSQSFGKTLGVGAIGFILTPILIIFIAMTIVGIPLAILLTMIYFILIYFTKIWVGYFIGRKLLLNLKMGERRGWALVVGLFIYYLLNMLSFGWFISLLVIIVGLGVTYREKWEFIKLIKSKKIL